MLSTVKEAPDQMMQRRMISSPRDYILYSIDSYSYILDGTIYDGAEFAPYYPNIAIGKFTSISRGFIIKTGINHCYNHVAMGVSDLFNTPKEISWQIPFHQNSSVMIQNDVWIGDNVSMMDGVNIRNGAVILPGSHVVSDIEPYAIYGGNPARLLKYRFDEETRKKLLAIQWWNWDFETIKENAFWFQEDARTFCDHFYDPNEMLPLDKIFLGKRPSAKSSPAVYQNYHTYLIAPFFDDPNSVYPRVLDCFLELFYQTPCRLVLFFLVGEVSKHRNIIKSLQSIAEQSKSLTCTIDISIGNEEGLLETLLQTDCLIINRHPLTIRMLEIADIFQKGVLYGTDIPVWDN